MGEAVRPVVFIQTNDPEGNQILAYERARDGMLTRGEAYQTGGNGGAQQSAPSDPLASQRSLAYDERAGLLYAVNAASNTLSTFGVRGARLTARQILPTDGEFPSSVASAGDLVYVLNAGGEGSVSGYQVDGADLTAIPGSTRQLGLGNSNPPFFLSSPAQVGFTPDGRHLLVTTKSHDQILAFAVNSDGSLGAAPVINHSAGAVPFAFVFHPAGHLVVAEASGALSSYTVNPDGTCAVLTASLANGQKATCWLAYARGFLYAVNAASGTISGYAVDGSGALSLLHPSGVNATLGNGAIDVAATPDGQFLYVENGATATVHIYHVEEDGQLGVVGEVTGLPRVGAHSAEGIVAL